MKFSSALVFTDLSDHFPIYLSLSVPKKEITVNEKGESSFRTFTDKEISNLIHSLQSNDWSSVLEANDTDWGGGVKNGLSQLNYFCVVWELCWISIFLLERGQGILHLNAHGCLEV